MDKKEVSKVNFWFLALRFTIVFVVVILIIQAIWELINSGNMDAVSESLSDGTWKKFIFIKGSLSAFYGLGMAYFTKKRLKNKKF